MQQIIDLTYPIHEGMFKYPSDPEIEIEKTTARVIDEIYKSGNLTLNMRNHHGTHIDTPAHKLEDGSTIDKYFLWKFINNSALVDLRSTAVVRRNNHGISLDDLYDFSLERHQDTEALVFYTGFCDLMKQNKGKLKAQGKKEFENIFPYFDKRAVEHILRCCPRLNIVGIDSFSVDRRGSNSEVHRAFFEKRVLPLETLYNLGRAIERNPSLL